MEGYDIFMLSGELPKVDGSKMGLDSKGSWWDIDSIAGASKSPVSKPSPSPR
jgi:hypothetical protein